MPFYDYKCPVCGTIELFHSISTKLTECPECKKQEVVSPIVRLISKGTNFQLNGGGWGVDLYSKSDK